MSNPKWARDTEAALEDGTVIHEVEADEPPIEPGTVFREMTDQDTVEIAISPTAYDLTVDVTLRCLRDELIEVRGYQQATAEEIIEAVRKRVAG